MKQMTKIEEIILDLGYEPANVFTTRFSFEIEDIELICKKYAEYYAERCLEIASQNATVQVYWEEGFSCVNSDSITNIKLPEHD